MTDADDAKKSQKSKDQSPSSDAKAAPKTDGDAKPSLKDLAQKDGSQKEKAKADQKAQGGASAAPSSATPKTGQKTDQKAGQKAGQKTDQASDKGAKGTGGKSEGGKAGDQNKGGGGFMWIVLALLVIGGAGAAGWPYIGPKVKPMVAELRDLMGLAPRPTQATLPGSQPDTQGESPSQSPAPTDLAEASPRDAQAPTPAPELLAETVEQTGQGPDATDGGDGAMGGATTTPTDSTDNAGVNDAEALATQLDVLQSRVDALGSMVGDISGEDAQAALDATAELNRTLAALQSDLQSLNERVRALEDGSRADPTAPAQALVLATTQVRSRLIGDEPFAAELDALEQIAGDNAAVQEALSRLRPHAQVGIPTEAALQARFNNVAEDIINARTTGEAQGWLGRVKDGLGGLVTVRRTDPQAITDEVERAVAVAEAALELGDLAEAVEVLSTLQGAPGDAAAAWLGDARARVEAEAALEQLHGQALAALSAAGGR